MKTIICCAFFSLICGGAIAQDRGLYDPNPYFSAIIVTDVESSIKWYQNLLKLKIQKRMSDQVGFKIAILESKDILIELIQQDNSVSKKEILKDMPAGTNIQGMFKLGFKVTDMDVYLQYLASIQVSVLNVWEDKSTGKRNFLVTDPDGNLIQFFD